MAVKEKSIWWRIGNSLWVFLSLVPILYWLPFFYISLKVENKRFKKWGYIHLAIAVVLAAGQPTALGAPFMLASWIHAVVEFIHCLRVRKEYLHLLVQKESKYRLAEKITEHKNLPQDIAVTSIPHTAVDSQQGEKSHQPKTKLNVNTCTEAELCNLPGVSIIEAKKAIDYRETHGDFVSVEAFIVSAGIKPHVAARITDSLVAEVSKATVFAPKTASRVLDI